MAKQNTGFTTILPRYLDVIGIIEGMEKDKWQPINEQLTLPNLKARHVAAKLVVGVYDLAFEFDKIKTKERETAYGSLNSLVQRVLAAAINCKMADSTIEQIKTYKDVIDGNNIAQLAAEIRLKEKKAKEALAKAVLAKAALAKGITPPVEDAEPPTEDATPSEEETDTKTETNRRSVSKQSYDLRYDNFKRLVTLLTVAGTYKTNIPDLTLASLNGFANGLEAANKGTNDADKAWADSVANRNACLQGPENSIYTTVRDIKTELISIETKRGANYKKVAAIKIFPL